MQDCISSGTLAMARCMLPDLQSLERHFTFYLSNARKLHPLSWTVEHSLQQC
jgi:hypothetical protein